MNYDLKGRVAVVTGSGKGIGRGIAYMLAEQGVRLITNYNYNAATAEETTEGIRSRGGESVLVKADVSTPQGAAALVKAAIDNYGTLDILVNNAALQSNFNYEQYDEDGFDLIIKTNLGGYFNCVKAALPYLKNSPYGRIINIGSVHSEIPFRLDPVYAMSKGAIKAFTREVALAVGKYNITANLIMPAGVSIEFKTDVKSIITPITERLRRELPPARRFHRSTYCIERSGRPDETAGLVCYLASDIAAHVTGSLLVIDGGFSIT